MSTAASVTFRTKDMNLAAFLWCEEGAELVQVGGSGGRILFCLELPITQEAMQDLQLRYANGKTRVEPLAYVAKQNQLRDLLYQTKGLAKDANGKRKGTAADPAPTGTV